MRWTFESSGWVKQTALPRVGGLHPAEYNGRAEPPVSRRELLPHAVRLGWQWFPAFRLELTLGSPGALICWLQILGFLSLQPCMSQFLIINLFLYKTHTHTHRHPTGSVSLENPKSPIFESYLSQEKTTDPFLICFLYKMPPFSNSYRIKRKWSCLIYLIPGMHLNHYCSRRICQVTFSKSLLFLWPKIGKF